MNKRIIVVLIASMMASVSFSSIVFADPIDGSGTPDRLAKFMSASTTIGDSLFSDDGVNGALTSGNFYLQMGSIIDSIAPGALNFGTATATSMTFGRLGQSAIFNSNVLFSTSTSIMAQGLSACDKITTDGAGTVVCGSDLVNHINVIVGSGHSIMRGTSQQGNGLTNLYYRWTTRLAQMLHAQEINRAVDGATSYYSNLGGHPGGWTDVVQAIIPPRNQAFTPGNSLPTAPYLPPNFLGLVQYGINDLATLIPSTGGATAANLVDFKEAMRTIIARYQASAVFEENTNNSTCASSPTCVAYTNGTDSWALQAGNTFNSGNGLQKLSGVATGGTGSLSICLPADLNSTGGTIDLGILADTYVDGNGANGAVWTTTLDGTPVDTTDTRGLLTTQNAPSGGGRVLLSIVRRVPVPAGNASGTTGCNSSAQHKIDMTVTGVTTQAFFDYYQIEATSPAPMLVFNVAKDPVYTAYGSSYMQPNDADVNTMNAVLAGVTSEFTKSVMTVDEDTALNKDPNNLSIDGLHPNDLGHVVMAEAAYKTLANATIPAQQGTTGFMGSSSGPSIFTTPTLFQNAIDSASAFSILSANGTSLLNVDTLNKLLGIGSSSPWGLLSVNANGLAKGAPQFVVGSSTATNFIIANNGKVGIGTSTPSAMLSVGGDIFASLLNLAANGLGLDTLTAGTLSIGSTTATAVTIGRSSTTASIPGTIIWGKSATTANCNSSASPAVCAAATAGSVALAAAATTLVVNTTAVTANSQILITEDSSLGTRLGTTCNTTTGRLYTVSARTAGASFTIKSSASPATTKACLSYWIIN